MFEQASAALMSLADRMSVEWFTFVGSFIEEVVAPIPSPVVMTVAGSIASSQGHAFTYLFVLSFIGAAGKTIGALLVYGVSYYLGDIFVRKFGRFFGVSIADIESLSKRLDGGWKDLSILTFLRALPVMSSAVVSIGSGILRVGFLTYVIATFVGTVIRDFFYLYVGFSGIVAYRAMVDGLDSIEGLGEILIGLCVVIFLGWLYWRHRSTK